MAFARQLSRSGRPEWRTVWSVVLPTARTGIITAVVLGVARAVGETAPLLFTIFGNSFVNANPFHGPQSSLTLFLFQNIKSSNPAQVSLAYTAALVLVMIVLVLFTITRILGRTKRSRNRLSVVTKAFRRDGARLSWRNGERSTEE